MSDIFEVSHGADASNTSGQGWIDASYKNLVRVLGKPEDVTEESKITTHWTLTGPGGVVVILHDWKATDQYDDLKPSVFAFRALSNASWSIGAPNETSGQYFKGWLSAKLSALPVEIPKYHMPGPAYVLATAPFTARTAQSRRSTKFMIQEGEALVLLSHLYDSYTIQRKGREVYATIENVDGNTRWETLIEFCEREEKEAMAERHKKLSEWEAMMVAIGGKSSPIKDSAHAVRVLEALVKHEEDRLKRFKDYYDAKAPMAGILIRALAEGAKAVLEKQKESLDEYAGIQGPAQALGAIKGRFDQLIALAQAYAPRMKEAGMTVPE